MQCEFQPLVDGRQFCPGCGTIVRARGRVFAGECSGGNLPWVSSLAWQSPCRYLGPKTGEKVAKCCGGGEVRTDEFRCDHPLHESTTEAGCLQCLDYAQKPANLFQIVNQPASLGIGIITAPRAVPTLSATIKSLRRAGFRQPIDVFSEPETPAETCRGGGVLLHVNRETLGCYRNWLSAARWLLANTESAFVLMMEDDVECADGAAAALWDAVGQFPDAGYFSLYTPAHNVEAAGGVHKAGWQPLGLGGNAWGALAWCFPRAVLEAALRWELTPPVDGTDQRITALVADQRRPTYFHLPSLAKHTGQVSSLGHPSKPGFRAVGYQPWWRGGHRRNSASYTRLAPISVAFLMPAIYLGGVETWLASLLKYSDPARVRWSVGLTNPAAQDAGMVRHIAAAAPLAVGPLAISRLAGHVDAVVTWGLPQPRELLGDFSGPLVIVSHGSGSWTTDWMREAIDERTHVAAVSKQAAAVCPGPARVIDNGIDLARCQPRAGREATRAAWGLADEEIALGYLGRLSPEKNCHHLAELAAALGPPYRAVFVGPAYAAEYVRQLKATDQRAIFTGPVEHVGDSLAAMDCLLMTSAEEGSCLVVLEALAAGVPLVGTPVGLLPELHDRHGYLYVPVPIEPTTGQLATAVEWALSLTTRPLIETAKAIVAEHYTAQRMARDWTEYLEEIMSDKPQPEGPSLARKGLNFARALGRRFVRSAKGQEVYVGDDAFAARLSVCEGCELLKTVEPDGRECNECTHPSCGCDVVKKARWAGEDCPLKKWPPLTSPPA